MNSEPFVSVIIPVHNRPRELERAVSSVLAQTYRNYEIIIVDDCSEDNTFEFVQTLQQRDPRIHGYRNEKNGGGAYSRNQGVTRARGELIAFLDSDDEWISDKLQKQVDYIDGREGVVLSTYFILKKQKKLVKYGGDRIRTGDIRKDLLTGYCSALTSGALLPRTYLDRVGGWSSDLRSMQDYDLWIKLSEFYKFECIPEYLVIVHADADVRISIDPTNRISGINTFFNKWSSTIEREVGKEYVENLRNTHLGTVFFNAAITACRAGDKASCLEHIASLRSVGQVTKKRFVLLWIYRLMLPLKWGNFTKQKKREQV